MNPEYQNSENTEIHISAPTDTEDPYLPATMRTEKRSSDTLKSATLKSENRTFDKRSATLISAKQSDCDHNQSDWETPVQPQQGFSHHGAPPPLSRPQGARSLFNIPAGDESDNDAALLFDCDQHSVSSAMSGVSGPSSADSAYTDTSFLHDMDELFANNTDSMLYDILTASGDCITAPHILRTSLLQIFNVLPVLPQLGLSLHDPSKGHRKNDSLSAAAADLQRQRPDIIKAITDVTHTTGPTAREQLFTAFNLFQNHGRIHRILIYALICYIWTHHEKSNFRNQAESIIYDYVLASSDTEVTTLLGACSEGRTMNYKLSSSFNTVTALPGVLRLTLTTSMTRSEFESVTKHWRDIWQAMCNYICKEDFSTAHISDLDKWLRDFDITKGGTASHADILAHPLCQPGIPIQLVHSELHKALLKIEIAAHRSKQSSRTPSADMRKKNICFIVRAAHPRVWVRFLHLLDTHDLHIDQLSYEEVTQWIFKAERQPSDKSAIIALVNSIMGPLLPDTDAAQSRSTTSATNPEPTKSPPQGSAAVYMLQGKDPHAKVFEGLCGPGVLATQQVRDQAAIAGKCSNCFNWKDRKYPPHMAHQCPYTTPDCVERTTTHLPITPNSGRPLRTSPEDIIKAFLADRKSFLANPIPKVPPKIPSEPIRNVTFHPVQTEEITDDLDDTDESTITVPPEPQAKGTIRAPAWATSAAKLRTHFMMFHTKSGLLHDRVMRSSLLNSGLFHWGD